MGSKKLKLSPKASLPFKASNKEKRERLQVNRKKAQDSAKRDTRFRRRREEDKNPRLREERIKQNVPLTLERKRVWDNVDNDTGDGLGVSVDVARMKHQKLESEASGDASNQDAPGQDEDNDSMIDSSSDVEADKQAKVDSRSRERSATERATSPTRSTASTNFDLTPGALAARFPTLFSSDPPSTPKILITTSLNSTLHHEAQLLTSLFPYSVYIPRSAHHYSHKYSVREIAAFASNRHYTALLVLKEDQKKPTGLTFVHLPSGPSFTFSISNWIEGKKLPGHGNPTDHIPELILNNFRTPLGLLTAHMFRMTFPPQPEFQGRQVVTLHNQRDYIFVRRHRYVFREKRATEKSVMGADGKEIQDVKGIKVGLQEIGPRFTLKLRRIDGGIQKQSGQDWEWKGGMDKVRTKFQL
ncbi:ribosome production factor 1 [Physcia stellaris]|nr:ribosome production factor 1 [Physcia stellaris]